MDLDLLFRMANLSALAGWIALVLLPRDGRLLRALVGSIVAVLCALYATLVAVHLVPSGGDFASLAGVRQLFTSPPVLLAGWLHYLAFDLCVGWWCARRMDAQGVPRLLQAPLLLTVFLVGPVGLLLVGGVTLALRAATREVPLAPEAA